MPEELSRSERKERTRSAILAAALELSADGGLTALSLRRVASKVGIVPTAFYRHFSSVEEVGLALIDECFSTFRDALREVRQAQTGIDVMVTNSLEILARHVAEQPDHFAFIARERFAGPALVRDAIRRDMELFELELAMDLGRLPLQGNWPSEDLRALAQLIVSAAIGLVEQLIWNPRGEGARRPVARAERQINLVLGGALRTKGRP